MPLISLETGLVVRRGARTLEFVEIIPGNKVQFRDVQTRQVQTMHLSRFAQAMLAKQIVPVLADEPTSADIAPIHRRPVIVSDLSSLKDADRGILDLRMEYVKAVRKRRLTRGQRAGIGKVLPQIAQDVTKKTGPHKLPSVSTVLGWMRQFELSGMNPASLLSGNRCRRRSRRVSQIVEDLIQKKIRTVYLTPDRHTLRHTLEQINQAMEELRKKGKLAEPNRDVSLSLLQRRVAELDKYAVLKKRFGVAVARSRFRTSVEGTPVTRPLERLECDHTLLNWVVLCDGSGLPLGRPTLTIVIDSLTGYPVGVYVSFYGPGLTSVLNVLKNSILPKDEICAAAGTRKPWIAFGIGETLLLDNGLEFHSPQFQLAAWELGIDIEYCRVRTPWLKPKVERFFLNLDYFSLSKGRVRKPMPNVVHLDPKKDAAITFSDFVRGLLMFMVDVYPFEPNSRTLDIPYETFKDGMDMLPPPVFPSSFDQLNLIAAMSKELTVGPGGVELRDIGYSSVELRRMKERVGPKFKTLVKWNPDDLECIYVQDPKTLAWITVPSLCPEYTNGLSWLQHLLIRKHKRTKNIEGGVYESLIRSRQDVHEVWMNGVAKKNRKADTRTRGVMSGLSSSRYPNAQAPHTPPPPQTVLAREEIEEPTATEIPDFESFTMA